LRPPGRSRKRWFENYLATALERDLCEFVDARRIDEMGRLLRLLTSQSANLLSYRAVGRRLEMHHDTVQAYVTLLEQMFLVQRLPTGDLASAPARAAGRRSTSVTPACSPMCSARTSSGSGTTAR
jgi:predicted AAA+ superfamily ATPase